MQAHSKGWWVMAARGVLALLAGGFLLFFPAGSLQPVVTVFGVFSIAIGTVGLTAGLLGASARERWWPLMLEGLASIAAGIVAFAWPGVDALLLLFIIGAWALALGLLQLVEAFNLQRESSVKWLLAMTGAFTVLFGAAAFFGPGVGLAALLWLLGVYALAFAFLQFGLAAELRGLRWQRRGA